MKRRLWICELNEKKFLSFYCFHLAEDSTKSAPFLIFFPYLLFWSSELHLNFFVMQGCLGNDVLHGDMREFDVACP